LLRSGWCRHQSGGVGSNFLHAIGHRDAETLCAITVNDHGTGPPKVGTADWSTCLSGVNVLLGMASGSGDIGKYVHAKVTSAEVDGDRATVTEKQITGVLDPELTLTLQRYHGRWYVWNIG
jgi:hypothetical protein